MSIWHYYAFLEARLQQIAETTSVAMLALLSLLDLVYMLRSTLAATLLKIIALPVPLLRQVPLGVFLGVFFRGVF